MRYSVIIPVYNGGDTLHRCIRSALALEDAEILLIDDGSTDESTAICEEFSGKYPHIRTFHQENAGVSAARNRGLAEARGAWIFFLDVDDRLDFRGFSGIPKCDLLIFPRSGGVVWEENGNLDDWFRADLLAPVWNKCFRRDILEREAICFREDLFVYEDLEFVLRYLKACREIRFQASPVCINYDSGKALGRVAKLENIRQVLAPIASACPEGSRIPKEVTKILAREMLTVSPEKYLSVRKACRSDLNVWDWIRVLRGAVSGRRRL